MSSVLLRRRRRRRSFANLTSGTFALGLEKSNNKTAAMMDYEEAPRIVWK